MLVDIDPRSLAEIGIWPWPRTLHADLVRAAAAAGAARVAFDIDFSSASQPASDAAFAKAIDETGLDTLLAAFKQHDAQGQDIASMPLTALAASGWPAVVNLRPDADGLVRTFPVAVEIGGELLPSIPAAIAGLDPAGEDVFGIDYSIDATSVPRISYADLISKRVDPALLAGRTLIVGANAVELQDRFTIPRWGNVSGSTVLALASETLLQGRALQPVELPWGGLAIAAILLVPLLRRARIIPGLCGLALLGVSAEAAAFVLQEKACIALVTAPFHGLLVCIAGERLLRELGIRKVLAWVAGIQASNSRAMLERVVEEGFGAVVIVDDKGTVRRLNDEARRLFAISVGAQLEALPALVARDCRAVLWPADTAAPLAPRSVTNLLRSEKDGAMQALEYTVSPLRLAAVDDASSGQAVSATHLCLTARDVTERQMVEDRMRHLALHDDLTGLANRAALQLHLDSASREDGDGSAGGFALIAFDLDRFKTVNDALGHAMGDAVLVEVARRLERCLPEQGLAARISSDEFMAFLPKASPEQAHEVAQHLSATIETPIMASGHRLSIRASFGLYCWSSDSASAEDRMRRADLALYCAEREGQLRLFEPAMEEDRLVRLDLERDLLEAVEAEALEVVFQPQVSLRYGAFTGAEALLRWQHPLKGPISPALFIPVAEEMGLIHRIGARVLRVACEEAASWDQPLRVAVNVSALQLSAGDVVSAVRAALDASGLPAHRLELEITESAFVNEDSRLQAVFDELTEIGVSFSLDDFGTGYSSLGYLHRFPVSKLKIDRSFVKDLPRSGQSLAILRAILALAQGLDLRTIAEGIENEEQAECLRMLGCAEAQGYLYSKPIDASAMRDLLTEPSADDQAVRARALA